MNPYAPLPDTTLNPNPAVYKTPTGNLSEYGFSIELEIMPKSGGTGKIKKIMNKKRINPKNDFNQIITYIRKEAKEKKGFIVYP